MKQFHHETLSTNAAAHSVIETAWRVLGMVKAEVGRRQMSGLTLTQMRSLGFLIERPEASLSELAEHLGLQMPTTSKVVEELVQQGWATREVVPANRRKLTLNITASGREAVEVAAEPAMTRMAELLAQLTEKERDTIDRAMALLHPLVQPGSPRDRDETDERSADGDGRSRGKAQRSRTLRRAMRCALVAAALGVPCIARGQQVDERPPWMNAALTPEQRTTLLGAMTQEEKFAQLECKSAARRRMPRSPRLSQCGGQAADQCNTQSQPSSRTENLQCCSRSRS